uniref:TipC family immunity protein n=1 Tax=uncultured Streptococcus sp. TaxID=83427 RepID=UPI0025F9D581|nr:TipC family immunity protein [uncultured Streptococcus sp.]
MNKHFKKFLWLTPILLFCLYWLGIYLSLKNPMEEIVYSENCGVLRNLMVKPYIQTIGSDRFWDKTEGFKTIAYSKNIVSEKEYLSVTLNSDTPDWFYMYEYDLDNNATIYSNFKYDSSKKVFYQTDLYLTIDETSYEDKQLLDQLATYSKDRTWLKKQSKKVAEQYILGTWFKNGSSRYSLKNLGDMKIEYNKLIEE